MKPLTEQLIRTCGRHRAAVLAALAALGVIAALAAIFCGHFTNDMSRLFPDTRETRALFRILHDAHLADAVQLEFVGDGDITLHRDYLERTAEKLSRSPLLRQVTFRYRSDDPAAELASFATLAPRFLTPKVLDNCSPDDAAVNALRQLAFPVPGQARRLRLQPFGWEKTLLRSLQKLDAATGMDLAPELPFFVSTDRRRAMIAAETEVRIGDADAVRKLFAELRRCAAPLPSGVEMRIISGCSHTLGNEEVLKRDAAIAGAVSLALFLGLFLWAYRGDKRALWIPVLPLYSSLLALGIMAVCFREICLYVIGLGGCITGLAVDQGIHVYAAFRGENAERRTAALALPMLLSAATSIAVFAFLGLTGISAYLQLAVFAGLSLAFSAILALAVLPVLLDRDHRLRRIFPEVPPRPGSRRAGAVVIIGAALLAVAVPGVLRNADFALDSLDGTPENIRAEEADFRRAWHRGGNTETAVLAAAGSDREAALEHLAGICAELDRRGIDAAAPPRPPRRVQAENRRAWRTPEVAAKIARLAAECRAACAKHRLPEEFFQPFFSALTRAITADDFPLPPILKHIDRKMIKSHGKSAAAVALLRDTPENVRAVREVLKARNDEHAALLSKGGFRALIREELGGRFLWLLTLSVAAALLLVYMVFRNYRDMLLAMVPVLLAWSAVALVLRLTGFRATPAAAFAAVLLTGLAVDYGIYAVCQLRRPDELDTHDPILLSAATTIAGAAALLASRHPALFGTGAVLAPGIFVACLSGVYIVPRLGKVRSAKVPTVLWAVLLLFLSGCAHTVPWQEFPDREAQERRMQLYPGSAFRLQATVTAEFRGRQFRFVLAAEIDPETEIVKLAGIDPGSGALLFRNGEVSGGAPRLGPALAENPPEALLKFISGLPDDLRRIFIAKNAPPLAAEEKTEYIAVYSNAPVEWRLRRDGSAEKCGGKLFSGTWRAEYRDAGRRVIYRRNAMGYSYTLVLTINNLQRKGS